MTRVALNPIFDSYAVVLVMAAGLICMLFLRPQSGRLSSRGLGVLLALRVLMILGLVLAMLRPAIVASSAKPQSAVLLVLADQSRSMQQPAAAAGASRWEAQAALLRESASELDLFDERFAVRLYGYDQQLQELELRDGVAALPSGPQGDQTDLSSCLAEALQHELGRRVAGILMLGDGAQTAVLPRVELRQTLHELSRLDAPLYSVTFGAVGDARQARDVSVENMADQFSVFVKNELRVEAGLRVRGFANKEIAIELAVEDEQGEIQTLGPRYVAAARDGEIVPISFPLVPDRAGEYRLRLRAAVQPGELLAQNNELSAFLTVLEGGLRVLYLYGDLNGEQQQLRRSIDAAQDIQLDDRFVALIDRQRWPIDLSDWLSGNSYDAVFIESLDVTALADTDLQAISDLVAGGSGLIMIGGYSSFGAGGYQRSPLSDVLPVEMGRFDRQEIDPQVPISRDLHLWGEQVLTPAREHPTTQLAAGSANQQLWESLPPLRGANKLNAKPASQVLLQTTGGEPILIAGSYGSGRTLAFAGNTTARWWRYGHDAEHRRFWRQIVLWLAQRDDVTKNDVWIQLEQRRFSRGQAIEFTAGAADATGEPLRDIQLRAQLRGPQRNLRAVELAPAGDAWRGQIPPLDLPGDYEIEVTAARNGTEIGQARTRFHVLDEDLELSNPLADHQQMAQLANATQAAGGKPVAAEEVPSLLSQIRAAHQNATIEVETKWELAATDSSAWLLFLALVSLISTEWILRKRWGLV